MIINSQFFITHYNGKDPLPLKNPSTELAKNPVYSKFIQGIGSIYSSQDINGRILKFWTKLTEIKDELGNTKYLYIPHPDSTLEYLDSKLSYYFIIRDTAFLPLKIPNVGGTVTSFADKDVLPKVQINDISMSGSSHFLNIQVDNVQINETYRYKFNCINSNWPANITPLSGTLKSPTGTGNIHSILTLSPTTENCSSSNLAYNIPNSCLTSDLNNKHITMQLEITPQSYTGDSILSNEFTATCNDCLPNVSLQSNIENEEDRVKNKKEKLSIMLNNFSKYNTYSYSIQALSATWPYYISQPTGLIKVSPETSNIEIDGLFCHSVESYPSNTNNVLPYIAPNNIVTKQSWYRPAVIIRAVLTDQSNTNIIHYSNLLKLTCTNYVAPSSINASIDVTNIQDL